MSDQVAEIFSPEHTPEVQIRDAARMSMSIPLYFKCVRYGEDRDVMVDGGVSMNYPLNIFDDIKYLSNADNREEVEYNDKLSYRFNHETLNFQVDSKNEIEFNKTNWANEPVDVDNILNYAKPLVGFMHSMANKKHLHKSDWGRSVFIDSRKVETTDYDIPPNKVQELIESGKERVRVHFDCRDSLKTNFPQ